MANTTLGVITESANESTYVWLTKADDEISTSFTIDWGDGSTVESYQASATDSPTEYTHTYATVGSYTIEIEVTSGKLRFFKEYGDYFPSAVDSNVYSVSTGDGLAVIGPCAFWSWGYETSVSVTFGSDLELIDETAFQMVSGISTIYIPAGIELGYAAFDELSNYDDVEGEECPVESVAIGCDISDSAFHWAKISSLTLYAGIETISEIAFSGVEGLTEVAIPSTVTSIGRDAFADIESLTTVTIRATTPPTLTDGYPFSGCSNLTAIYVPTESLSAYQSASGWSTGSSLFVGTDVGPDPTPPSPEPPGPEPTPVVITGKEYLNDAGVMTLIGFIQYALATKQEIMQVSELVEASEDLEDKIYQYIGETTASYTNGFFYKCVASGAAYIWQEITFGGGSGTGDIQVTTIPTASSELLGTVYQYIGATDSTYTHGFFYECVSDGQPTPTYSWQNVAVNITPPVASGSNDGLMSSTMFNKLDGITNASGSNDGLMSSAMYTKLDNITTASGSNDGLMSSSMYTKLDGIALATTSDIDAIFS